MLTKTRKYLNEVIVELKKSTWPWNPKEKGIKKYRELIDLTLVVFVAMILLGAFVSLNDLIMQGFVEALNVLIKKI